MNCPPQSNKCEEKDEKGPLINQIFDETKNRANQSSAQWNAKRGTHECMNGEAQWQTEDRWNDRRTKQEWATIAGEHQNHRRTDELTNNKSGIDSKTGGE